ncbi:hypothetical protein FRAAL5885 [Frankia alni ACN14a]|uniref:Uncharacterized protein n=1 Tax=Frankia alni (strain DSM 45986 / CECT 9034 / ACN14a) TaxID=326424 RepID=Q0RDF9_FRAAA|nr:hypothetical protein FRAAL5885 [Frankia alni ACN14a]
MPGPAKIQDKFPQWSKLLGELRTDGEPSEGSHEDVSLDSAGDVGAAGFDLRVTFSEQLAARPDDQPESSGIALPGRAGLATPRRARRPPSRRGRT